MQMVFLKTKSNPQKRGQNRIIEVPVKVWFKHEDFQSKQIIGHRNDIFYLIAHRNL